MNSLLALVQDVCDRIGIQQPTSLVGSTDPQSRMLLRLMGQEGVELARRHNWQAITKETTFSTVASTEGYTIPTDFDRMVEGSMFNRTMNRPVAGPLTPQRWQQLKSLLTASVWDAYRIRGSQILMMPTPTGVSTIAYEYVSKYWCGASGDTAPTQAAWADDTNITFLDEELMKLGLTWRFLRARGLDYSEAFRLYEDMFAARKSEDGSMSILDLGGGGGEGSGVFDPFTQDGNWTLN